MPAAITNAVAIVGKSAAFPGNGVVPENVTAATAIPARPSQPRGMRRRFTVRTGIEPVPKPMNFDVPMARAAPIASSQARADVEK
jgi:hypothetical protein